MARNAEECILLLQDCEVGVLSLDFDLGWYQPTGIDVAQYIVASGRYPREIYLHTSSDSGRLRMYGLLYQNKPDGVRLNNGPMSTETLQTISQYAQE